MKTPLRYPGGKTKFANKFLRLINENNITAPILVEPFCGGAGASIKLLLDKSVDKIYLNDKDISVYAFWYSVLNNTQKLVQKINKIDISVSERNIQKNIYAKKDSTNLLKLGFAFFYLNRTSFSGIVGGGPLGGTAQKGKYKIGCRFNKKHLISLIELIAKEKKRIRISNKDAVVFLKSKRITLLPKKSTIVYLDPPYYLKSDSLYLNHYNHEDHKNLSLVILKDLNLHWIVSYDNVKEIKKLYKKAHSRFVDIRYSTYKNIKAREVLFFSRGIKIPVNI